MIDINLLPPQEVLSKKTAQFRYQLTIGATVGGAALVIFFGLLFSLDWLGQNRLNTLLAQRQNLGARFDADTNKLELLLSLKDKIIGIKKVQQVRPDLSLAVSKLNTFSVDGVAITALNIGSEGTLVYSVTVRDDQALAAYLTKLESDMGRAFFKNLTITGLQLGQGNSFSFSVAAQFDKTKL